MQRTISTLLAVVLSAAASAADTQRGEWPYYGGDAGSSKYSPLAQVDAGNVKGLQVAWTWNSPDDALVGAATRERPGYFKPTPIMIDDVLYTSTAFSQVAAIDAGTGATRWVFDPRAYAAGRRPANSGWQHRGVAYWSGKVGGRTEQRILIATGIGELIALDARSGTLIKSFGNDGRVDLQAALIRREEDRRFVGFNAPPMIVGNSVVVGCTVFDRPTAPEMPAGHIQAFDVVSGASKWIFHTVPQGAEPGVRDVGGRIVEVLGQHQRLAAVQRRSRARPRLHPSRHADQRLLRRRPQRRQPLRRKPARDCSRQRQAGVALPGRAPRPVGLRFPGGADTRRHHGRRPSHRGGRASQQAGLHVRVRARERQAGLADRRAAGTAVHRARREDVGDATVPDQAAAIRAAGIHDRRPDRLHAGVARGSAADRRRLHARPSVCAADRRRRERQEGRAAAAERSRRCKLGWRRLRSRSGLPVSAVGEHRVAGGRSERRGKPEIRVFDSRRGRTARTARPAADQAAVRRRDRHRSEQGCNRVAGRARRRPARSSGPESAEPAAARRFQPHVPVERRAARDEVAAVPEPSADQAGPVALSRRNSSCARSTRRRARSSGNIA